MISKYYEWCKAHPIKTALILIIGIPFLIGIISGIFGSTESHPVAQVSTPQDQDTTPTLTLTQRLTQTVNDPYWSSTTPTDYSSATALQVQSVVFSTYANDVIEGQKSSLPEDNKLALDLKKKLVVKQVSEYPKMRKAYADLMHTTLWEQDIDVSASGTGNTTLTLVGAVFASNKGIAVVETPIESMLEELRFKRVNYKWIQHDDEYQYFNLKSVSDSDLKPIGM